MAPQRLVKAANGGQCGDPCGTAIKVKLQTRDAPADSSHDRLVMRFSRTKDSSP